MLRGPTQRDLRQPAGSRTRPKDTPSTSPASLGKLPIPSFQFERSGGSCFQRHFACLDLHCELHLVAAQRLFDLARFVAHEPSECLQIETAAALTGLALGEQIGVQQRRYVVPFVFWVRAHYAKRARRGLALRVGRSRRRGSSFFALSQLPAPQVIVNGVALGELVESEPLGKVQLRDSAVVSLNRCFDAKDTVARRTG